MYPTSLHFSTYISNLPLCFPPLPSPLPFFFVTLSKVRPPAITVQPASQELIVLGKSASFVVTAEGNKLLYQWRKDETDIPGATSSTFTIGNVANHHEGLYLCVVSNDAGFVKSTAAILTVCKYLSVIDCAVLLYLSDYTHIIMSFIYVLLYTVDWSS